MIPISLVIKIHKLAIAKHGGLDGVRDENGLLSAIERPFSGFGDTEFYRSPEEKAAAVSKVSLKTILLWMGINGLVSS
jgi:death on curing protein